MDHDDIDASELAEHRICYACIGEDYLKDDVKKGGKKAKCAYCNKTAKTISIGDLADRVEEAFEDHYYRTSDQPTDLESMMLRDKESSYEWDRHGQKAEYAIAQAAKIEEEPADDVRQVLGDRHGDFDAWAAGEECEFDEESHYEEKSPGVAEHLEKWRFFEHSIKSQARMFNREAEAVLEELFESLHDLKTRHGKPVIVDAGPGQPISALYRARTFTSDSSKLEQALMRPDIGIGPPPSAFAGAGRMNARGISVFYGATDPHIAISEVRPPVGSRVVVARFHLVRPLRLLDVAALEGIYITGSIFDSSFIGRLEKAKFLERISNRITIPIMPEDEPSDYLTTQAIADYLANRSNPQIDGIIYPSVQNGSAGDNVVLFHKSSRVEAMELPSGTKLSASLDCWTDEGPEPDYYVSEETPRVATKEEDKDDPFFSPDAFHGIPDPDADARTPSLRLDAESVRAHHVQKVEFKTAEFRVRRHRSEEHDDEF